MSKLYEELAPVYQAMYATFIDYEAEFQLYHKCMNIHAEPVQTILELGCGTGMLAQKFVANGLHYLGLDYSQDMLEIAKRNTPSGIFYQGKMQHFRVKEKVQSVVIAGRTTSYLTSNTDIMQALASIRHNLSDDGVLCFDFIDANRFIPAIAEPRFIVHEAQYEGIQYKRESEWLLDLSTGLSLRWNAHFYKKTNQSYHKIGSDTSVVRMFTLDEWKLFLQLNGFELIDLIDRDTYAFPTFVLVAKVKNQK